jgi:hypothetical protein
MPLFPLSNDGPGRESRGVLFLAREPEALDVVISEMRADGYRVYAAENLGEARAVLEREPVDYVVCRSGTLGGGREAFIEWLSREKPRAVAIVLSEWADAGLALEGIDRARILDEERPGAEAEEGEEPKPAVRRTSLENRLEARYPGITRLRRDARGFLILGGPSEAAGG